MSTLLQDIRYCLRTLRLSPGFTAVVILTLALGIGANTAIFSIVDAVLLRPLPFHDAGQLVQIVDNARGVGLHNIGMSVPEFQDLGARAGVFDQISAAWPVDGNLTGAERPERVEFLAVSPSYFSLLGARAQIGRVFGPEDQAPGFAEACIISDGLWRRLFGADPKILGKKIRLDNDLYKIAGVMPAEFRHPGRTVATDVEVWGTAGFTAAPFPSPPPRSARFLPGAIGRLKPGITIKEAQSRLDAFTTALQREFPNDYRAAARWSVDLAPLQDSVVGNVRPLLWVLLGAVTLMLLTGCANVANLLLARAAGRQREVAIRLAMGAARGRLVRQLLTESVLLSVLAGAAGVAAARGSVGLLVRLAPAKVPRLHEVVLDWRVLGFALLVSVITGLLFGLAPALEASGLSLANHLREGGRGLGGSRRHKRMSGLLVIAEFAICLVLMTGAGLLVKSFWRLTDADPGFNPDHALVARIWLPVPNDPRTDRYAKVEDRTRFAQEVLRRMHALPGVTSAAMTTSVPLSQDVNQGPVTVESHVVQSGDLLQAEAVNISPEYFKVMATPLIAGRLLEDTDQQGAPSVVLVDRTTARRFWPGESAIGKRLKLGPVQSRLPWATVVGVVGDIRHDGMDVDGVPHLYFSIYQRIGKSLGVVLRSAGHPAPLAESVRREIQAVDPELPVFGVRTLNEMVQVSLSQRRFSAQLMALFAALAMLLAAVGIAGVLAYSMRQRTREIGIRMALGARRSEVIRMVLWQGMRLTLAGIAIGILCALGFSRLLARLLYGVSATDPVVFGAVALVLAAAAALASYIPAWRATRIDPMNALRWE